MKWDFSKFIKTKEVKKIVDQFMESLDGCFVIEDIEHKLIIGENKKDHWKEYPVYCDEVVGWVYGEEKASVIALMLTYMGKEAYSKKQVGKEALDKYREITLLHNISQKLASCVEQSEVAKLAMEEASKFIQNNNGSVFLIHKKNRKIEVIEQIKKVENKQVLDMMEKIANIVIATGKEEIVNDIKFTSFYSKRTFSILCAPLKIKDRVLGSIQLIGINTQYSSMDLKFLNTIAREAAIAMENANLYNSLKESFFQTVQALGEVVEKRDAYTAGHAKRVAIYSVEIAEEMGFSKTDITKVKLAALLHDIGKIGVEDSILLKKGRLTSVEYEAIKKHTIFGVEILENISSLKDIVPYIRSHHERYDGSGYPDGKKKEEIPLISRVLSVADSFDAMTSNRPYRSVLETDFALNELIDNSNKQFDPNVVQAFLKVYKRRKYKLPNLA